MYLAPGGAGTSPNAQFRSVKPGRSWERMPLLRVDGMTAICHGDSPSSAFRNAMRVAIKSGESNMVEHLRRELSQPAGKRV